MTKECFPFFLGKKEKYIEERGRCENGKKFINMSKV